MYTTASSITGYQAIAPGWRAALTAHGAVPDADTILAAYDASCRALHLDPNLALSQACHEATWFTSTRWTQEWNPAGLGITSGATPPNPFKSPQEGIRAHGEHLCCYCYTLAECPCDHNHLSDRRHFFHDGMPRLTDLERFHVDAHGVKVGDRMWAVPNGWPDTTQDPQDYVRSIVAIANSIGASPVSNVPTAADLGYPGHVHYATGSGESMNIADVRWFVVHDTEGYFAGDENTLSGQISAHLLIDKSGEWRFMVPLDTVAYAAGNINVNRQSINVEHSGFADAHDGGYTDAQYRCCAAFYRFCVKNGMVNAPAVYIGKQDADGGPEPDVPGILGHQDVPRDDGKPGWGGNYGHQDPGPTYRWDTLIGYIGNAPQPPTPPPANVVDGLDIGSGFHQLYTSVSEDAAARLRIFGLVKAPGQYDAYLIEDANDAQRAKGLSAVAHPIVVVDFERLPLIWDKGRTSAPWDVRVPMQHEDIALADDPVLLAILHAMQLVNEPI